MTWNDLWDAIDSGAEPSADVANDLLRAHPDPRRWLAEIDQLLWNRIDDRNARQAASKRAQAWVSASVAQATGPTSEPSSWLRLAEISRDPDPSDAGLAQALALSQASEGVVRAEALMLAIKARFFLEQPEPAAREAIEAIGLFRDAGLPDRVNHAQRHLAACGLFLHRWTQAFDLYEEVLQQRGPLFGGGGKTFHRRIDDPLQDAIAQAQQIGAWADLGTPEWVMAMGALAQRLDEAGDADGARLADGWFHDLLEQYEGERGVDQLHVVVRQLGERDLHAASMTACEVLVDVCTDLYGPDAEDTMIARNLYGAAAKKNGDHALAEPHYAAVAQHLVATGADNASVLLALWADCLVALDRLQEARGALERALPLAPHDTERWGIRARLTRTLPAAEQRAHALEVFEELRAADALASEVGTFVVETCLGVLLPAQDRTALDVQQALLDAARAQGDGPATWLEEHNLATVHAELGDHDVARPLLESVLARQEAALWPEHEHIAMTRRSLARLAGG